MSADRLESTPEPALDAAELRKELRQNRQRVSAIERDEAAVIYDLGRHVSNLSLDAGYDELAGIIRKSATLRQNLVELEDELTWLGKVASEHVVMKGDLDATTREAKALFETLETTIVELGAHASRLHEAEDSADDLREFLAELIEHDDEWRPAAVDDVPDARAGIRKRLRSLKERFEPKVDPTRGLYPRIGWRLLRGALDDRLSDPELRQEITAAKKGIARLLELERHQRFREESLAEFDTEMKDTWGYASIDGMIVDYENQRDEMRERLDALYVEIGAVFNTHRLHDYVEDSFVSACRRRIKRFHVRGNELRLRQRDIVRALKRPADRPAERTDGGAAGAPDRGDVDGA